MVCADGKSDGEEHLFAIAVRPRSPYSGRDCVKSLRSSYTGLYPQSASDKEKERARKRERGSNERENDRERERRGERALHPPFPCQIAQPHTRNVRILSMSNLSVPCCAVPATSPCLTLSCPRSLRCASSFRLGLHTTPCKGDCVKSLRSSYTGLYPQIWRHTEPSLASKRPSSSWPAVTWHQPLGVSTADTGKKESSTHGARPVR